jgi:hypothetical protein
MSGTGVPGCRTRRNRRQFINLAGAALAAVADPPEGKDA